MLNYLICLFLILQLPVYSASFVTHLFFAEKWMETTGQFVDNREEFVAGNLFPDIRYHAKISRKLTHKNGVTLEEISSCPSPFKAGVLLHCYVDERREELIKEWDIFPKFGFSDDYEHVVYLKFLEDEIFYTRMTPSTYIDAFNIVYEQELELNLTPHTIQEWHSKIKFYLKRKPSAFFKFLASFDQPFGSISAETIRNWSNTLHLSAKKPEVQDYTLRLEETLLTDFLRFRNTL